MSLDRGQQAERLSKIISQIESLAAKIAPTIIQIGHLRREAEMIEEALAQDARDESDAREVQAT